MMLIFRYEIPSQNVTSRRHWSKNHADVKLIAAIARAKYREFCNAAGKREINIIAYRKQLIVDRANLVGGAKYLIDGLVMAGVLLGDSDKLMTANYQQATLKDLPPDIAKEYGRRAVTIVHVL